MAETKSTKTPTKSPAKGSTVDHTSASTIAEPMKIGATTTSADPAPSATGEAKTRFNAALEEAKAGAAALRTEATHRAEAARETAKTKSSDLVGEARANAEKYGSMAKTRAADLAVDAKSAASDGIASLGQVVSDTAPKIDEKLGEQYGDYARKASRALAETSAKLEAKSVEELGDDAREMVRKSPGVAVGIAAIAGFMLARLFRGSRD